MSSEEPAKNQPNNSQSSRKNRGSNQSNKPQQNQHNNSQSQQKASPPKNDRNDEELLAAIKQVSDSLDTKLDSAVKVINSLSSRLSDLEVSKSGVKLEFEGATPVADRGTQLDPDFTSTNIKTPAPRNSRRQTLAEVTLDTNVLDPPVHEVPVTMTRMQPDYTNIYLKEISDLKHVVWFFNQILKYKSENNITLVIRNLISDKAINLLIARFRYEGIENRETYYSLSNGDLTDYVYKYVTARSLEEAYYMLIAIIFKMDGYKYSPTNADEFYEKFIQYAKEFHDIAVIIAYSAKILPGISYLPPCNKTPMGIITIVTKALSLNGRVPLVENIISQTPHATLKQWGEDPTGYTKFFKYLDILLFKEANRARAARVAQIQATTDFKTGVINVPFSDKSDPRMTRQNRFHNLFERVEHDSDDEYEQQTSLPHREAATRHQEEMDMPDDSFELDFHALQIAGAKPTTFKSDQPNGCFKMMAQGKCPRGNTCTFSHDSAVLARTCAYWINSLQKSQYYKPSHHSRPLTHLQQSSSEGSSTDA